MGAHNVMGRRGKRRYHRVAWPMSVCPLSIYHLFIYQVLEYMCNTYQENPRSTWTIEENWGLECSSVEGQSYWLAYTGPWFQSQQHQLSQSINWSINQFKPNENLRDKVAELLLCYLNQAEERGALVFASHIQGQWLILKLQRDY